MGDTFPSTLPSLLSVAAVLTGTENKATQSSNIATVLKSRLDRAYEILDEGREDLGDGTNLQDLQYITAKMSLCLVERVQTILDSEMSTSEETPPALGTRDLSQIRALLSIVFKWAIQPLSAELELHRPSTRAPASGKPQIIDLTARQLDVEALPTFVLRLLHLVFAPDHPSKIRQTWITTSILNHHAVDVLAPCLLLGWSPKPISDSLDRASKDIKSLSVRFINVLRPHEAITALGTILSSAPNTSTPFPHVPKACAHLLSNQLKRPDGVRGLCDAVFGEDAEDAEAAPLEKLEHIAKVLRAVPSNTKPEAYFQFMVPRILELLLPTYSEQTPSLHKRAAAFALSRMVSPTFQHHAIASATLLPLLHEPFLSPAHAANEDKTPPSTDAPRKWRLPPPAALKTLQEFLLHMDPSPAEVSTVLTPIVPELYALLILHRSSKTVDPTVRESLNALLNTWGRIVSSSDVIGGLCSIIDGAGGDWELGPEGFSRSAIPSAGPSISLLMAAELERGSSKDIDINANPFNLRPDPSWFVGFLKSLDRKDVASDVFVRLLNEYRELKETDSDPMRTLLRLQLILQVQSQLSSTILSRPEHVLSFIKHVLTSAPLRPSSQIHKAAQKRGLRLEDLRIVEKEESDEGDSDDEDDQGATEQPAEAGGGKDEIVVTAITLLLSILEGNSDISPHATPELNDILASLHALVSHASPTIRQLAREARLVLTARTASTSSSSAPSAARRTADAESAQEAYQKALKLLQDPIIPVRAHGLQVLRDLVSSHGAKGGRAGRSGPALDAALVPGILSIFLQSIQDDESYLFLNAVQGLAAMVDGYGKDVLRGVMDVYLRGTGVGGSGTATMSRQELDARVRVGEALNIVVKRCGAALGVYADILVPPLLAILRAPHLPTTLKTSALATLAQCAATHAPALTAYAPGLADGCVELVQLESVPARSPGGTRAEREAARSDAADSAAPPEPTDADPVTGSTKAAPLRRAALHFLAQLLRGQTAHVYGARRAAPVFPSVALRVEGAGVQGGAVPEPVLARARIVLGYVAATDEDPVTRVMAREALEFVQQYREASLGF